MCKLLWIYYCAMVTWFSTSHSFFRMLLLCFCSLCSTYHINFSSFTFAFFHFTLSFCSCDVETDTKGMCDLFMLTPVFFFFSIWIFRCKHIFMVSFITNAELKWFYLLTMDITITNNTSEMCGMTNKEQSWRWMAKKIVE